MTGWPTRLALACAERGWTPDGLVRAGLRRLCRHRLREELRRTAGLDPDAAILPVLRQSAVAEETARANHQHYEVPAAFFERVLGPRFKYSCGLWDENVGDLAEAEVAALRATAEHADLRDGQEILELGCGWGSLTSWMAERFPQARITAVSNSASQRAFIEGRLAVLRRGGVRVVTADMNEFVPDGRFDRIVSVEMMEHMRNWPALLARIAGWLRPEGRFLAHVF